MGIGHFELLGVTGEGNFEEGGSKQVAQTLFVKIEVLENFKEAADLGTRRCKMLQILSDLAASIDETIRGGLRQGAFMRVTHT